MARLPSLLASDAEREQVAERLRHASVEGRLSTVELDERLGALYSSRTYGELDSLVADLPATARTPQRRAGVPRLALLAAALTVLWAVVGVLARPRPSRGVVEVAPVGHGRYGIRQLPPGLHHAIGLVAPAMVGLTMLVAMCAVVALVLIRARA